MHVTETVVVGGGRGAGGELPPHRPRSRPRRPRTRPSRSTVASGCLGLAAPAVAQLAQHPSRLGLPGDRPGRVRVGHRVRRQPRPVCGVVRGPGRRGSGCPGPHLGQRRLRGGHAGGDVVGPKRRPRDRMERPAAGSEAGRRPPTARSPAHGSRVPQPRICGGGRRPGRRRLRHRYPARRRAPRRRPRGHDRRRPAPADAADVPGAGHLLVAHADRSSGHCHRRGGRCERGSVRTVAPGRGPTGPPHRGPGRPPGAGSTAGRSGGGCGRRTRAPGSRTPRPSRCGRASRAVAAGHRPPHRRCWPSRWTRRCSLAAGRGAGAQPDARPASGRHPNDALGRPVTVGHTRGSACQSSTNAEIRQRHGITPVPGLFVLGYRFQSYRSSNWVCGVGRDAAAITALIAGEGRASSPAWSRRGTS